MIELLMVLVVPATCYHQKFNLSSIGTNSNDTWNGNNDQYGNSANGNDPYSHWANAYGQWPQCKD